MPHPPCKTFLNGTLKVKKSPTGQNIFEDDKKLNRRSTNMHLRAQAGGSLFQTALARVPSDELHLEEAKSSRARQACTDNQDAPMMEGVLKKQAKTMLGFGPFTWHERWFVLDPDRGTFEYWEPRSRDENGEYKKPSGNPKHRFYLKNLIQLESNGRHFIFQVVFRGTGSATKEPERVLHLQAADECAFYEWLDALQPYGMRRGPQTPRGAKA